MSKRLVSAGECLSLGSATISATSSRFKSAPRQARVARTRPAQRCMLYMESRKPAQYPLPLDWIGGARPRAFTDTSCAACSARSRCWRPRPPLRQPRGRAAAVAAAGAWPPAGVCSPRRTASAAARCGMPNRHRGRRGPRSLITACQHRRASAAPCPGSFLPETARPWHRPQSRRPPARSCRSWSAERAGPPRFCQPRPAPRRRAPPASGAPPERPQPQQCRSPWRHVPRGKT